MLVYIDFSSTGYMLLTSSLFFYIYTVVVGHKLTILLTIA